MKKRIFAGLLAFIFLFVMAILPASAAVLTTVETQFSYNTSNPAWLKDLVLREDMTNPQAIPNTLTLNAKPEYPYSATAESFREEVSYFTALYSLDENTQKAAYLYVLQYVNQFATEATKNVSDEFIMEYLTEAGITYPEGGLGDYENTIFARTLYTLLSTGAVKIDIEPGTTVQAALILCLTQTLNIDPSTLALWSTSSVDTLDEYILAACKIALNTAGFRVTAETPKEEVYRLTAVMMIRKLGISIDEQNATPEEIQLKYLAALLGVQYDVSLDPDSLGKAMENGETALYILRCMGKEANITIRSDMSFSDAFNAVAENTEYFALDEGEFYADIEKYETTLQYKREKIWVCPTAYRVSSATETVMISVAGNYVTSAQYAEVALDTSRQSQEIPIVVTYQNPDKTVSKTYTVTVFQGKEDAPDTEDLFSSGSNGNSLLGIFQNNLGNTLAGSFYSVSENLPARVDGIIGLMTPNFDSSSMPNSSILTGSVNASADSLQSGGDFLSALMYSVSGGASQQSSVPLPSVGTQGPGGLSANNTFSPLSISFSAPTGGNILQGTPMLEVDAAQPPEGFVYETNDAGFITGLKRITPVSLTGNQTLNPPSASERQTKRLWPIIPALFAVIAILVIALVNRREKKKSEN